MEWEHQASSPAVDIHKDKYVLTVYGFSSGSVAENFTIQVYNPSTLVWGSSLSVQIGTTEQWYNQTIDSVYVDTSNSRITWIYNDTDQSDDINQNTLNIDYSGVRAYNKTMDNLPATHNSLEFSPDDQYHALGDNPLTFDVESGETYTITIKGVDGTGSPVSGGYLYFNTVDNSGTSTQLTTSWQNLYVDQSSPGATLSIYLWVNWGWSPGDAIVSDGIPTYTVNITWGGG